MTDQYLINKSIDHDRKAQKMLFERYAPYLLSVAQRYVRDFHLVEDVFLHSFEKIFKNLQSFQNAKGDFKYWAKKIIINEALNYLRSQKNYFIEIDITILDQKEIEPNVISQMNADELHQLILELRPPFGIIFNMVVDGYNYAEISDILNIHEATCRSYYMRSKAMLRDILLKQEYVHHGTK